MLGLKEIVSQDPFIVSRNLHQTPLAGLVSPGHKENGSMFHLDFSIELDSTD